LRVLIVEDEPTLGNQLKNTLEGAGYAIDLATDGEDGHYLGSTENYDAIILDLGLPEIDGLTVLDRWRKEGKATPVLVLTARDSWSDKVAGLDAGADDYLAKPFQTQELIARLRALIRRAAGNASAELIAGEVRLDTRSGRVTLAGEPIKMTAQEYKLLSYLMHHKGKVVSRTELIEHIYDQDFEHDRSVRHAHPQKARPGCDHHDSRAWLQPRRAGVSAANPHNRTFIVVPAKAGTRLFWTSRHQEPA
jgi:two-component system OmpR family response regulator